MLLLDGATFAVQKTFIREDADPTEDREHALDMLAMESAVVRGCGVVHLPSHLLELFDDSQYEDHDGWEAEDAYAEDAWWWCDDPEVTTEEIWEAIILDAPPETFIGGHSGMSRTNLVGKGIRLT